MDLGVTSVTLPTGGQCGIHSRVAAQRRTFLCRGLGRSRGEAQVIGADEGISERGVICCPRRGPISRCHEWTNCDNKWRWLRNCQVTNRFLFPSATEIIETRDHRIPHREAPPCCGALWFSSLTSADTCSRYRQLCGSDMDRIVFPGRRACELVFATEDCGYYILDTVSRQTQQQLSYRTARNRRFCRVSSGSALVWAVGFC